MWLQCLGCVRPNCLPNISISCVKERKRKLQRASNISEGVEVRTVEYLEKRPVMFAATCASMKPFMENLNVTANKERRYKCMQLYLGTSSTWEVLIVEIT